MSRLRKPGVASRKVLGDNEVTEVVSISVPVSVPVANQNTAPAGDLAEVWHLLPDEVKLAIQAAVSSKSGMGDVQSRRGGKQGSNRGSRGSSK